MSNSDHECYEASTEEDMGNSSSDGEMEEEANYAFDESASELPEIQQPAWVAPPLFGRPRMQPYLDRLEPTGKGLLTSLNTLRDLVEDLKDLANVHLEPEDDDDDDENLSDSSSSGSDSVLTSDVSSDDSDAWSSRRDPDELLGRLVTHDLEVPITLEGLWLCMACIQDVVSHYLVVYGSYLRDRPLSYIVSYHEMRWSVESLQNRLRPLSGKGTMDDWVLASNTLDVIGDDMDRLINILPL